ncbi:MAG: DUF4399 domain-containing protein [Rubrivivax sp.]|nr:DUF4399 domain-containing protein [Rubrivivax sp.]
MPHAILSLGFLLLAAGVSAEPLPRDPQERSCWLQHTRERTQVRLNEPTAVEVANLRDGYTVRSPFRVDFAVRGMGVIPAGQAHPKAGHHHVLLNTPLPYNPGQKIPFNDYHRHFGKGQTGAVLALPPGKHTLRLLFADHDHRPYFVFSPELQLQVAGPRSETPLRIDAANFATTCKAWYQDEITRPRPEGQRALITNLRDGEPVVSPFNLRLAVDGYGVAPKGRGGAGLGHFLLDVLQEGGRTVQAIDLGHGATQLSLFLAPGPYTLRLRFVDDSGRRDLVPAAFTPVVVTAQERL